MNEITAKGLEELKKELDYLKNVKVKEIAELIRHTASFGDLKENAAYHDAKDKQAFLQGKILELEERIRSSEVIKSNSSGKIQVGSRVTLLLNREEETIELVGPGQADPLNGKISYESPLGKAILDKSIGDEMKVQLGDNTVVCKILKIE